MTLQQILNQQAIDMLPLCKEFLTKNKVNTYSLVRNMFNLQKPLTQMSESEILDFDTKQLEILERTL